MMTIMMTTIMTIIMTMAMRVDDERDHSHDSDDDASDEDVDIDHGIHLDGDDDAEGNAEVPHDDNNNSDEWVRSGVVVKAMGGVVKFEVTPNYSALIRDMLMEHTHGEERILCGANEKVFVVVN